MSKRDRRCPLHSWRDAQRLVDWAELAVIHPEQFATLVVGNPEEIGNQLTSQGPVAKWDITIPPPLGEKQGKSPAGSRSK